MKKQRLNLWTRFLNLCKVWSIKAQMSECDENMMFCTDYTYKDYKEEVEGLNKRLEKLTNKNKKK